jgi:hypothetical protein
LPGNHARVPSLTAPQTAFPQEHTGNIVTMRAMVPMPRRASNVRRIIVGVPRARGIAACADQENRSMDIQTARAIIADSSRAPHQADWMLAGRVLADHWKRHPEELKPVRPGALTYDAKPRSSRESIMRSLNATKAMLNDTLRLARKRGLTRDEDLSTRTAPQWLGQQQTDPGGSEVTVGGKRIMKLDGDGSSYFIQTAGDGVWLVQAGDIDGMGDNGEGMPSGKIGGMPQPTGDRARDRHAAVTAQRDRGAKFAAQFNQRQRQRYGQ